MSLHRLKAVQLGNAPCEPVDFVFNADNVTFAHEAPPVNGEDAFSVRFVDGHSALVLGNLDLLGVKAKEEAKPAGKPTAPPPPPTPGK